MSIESILKWQKASQPLISEAADISVGTYFNQLGQSDCPSADEIEAADSKTQIALKKQVLSDRWSSEISKQFSVSAEKVELMKMSMQELWPDLKLPIPKGTEELWPYRIGFAAAVGSILGMMVLTPLTHYLLDMREAGLFVGPPAGAFVMVLATWYSARSKAIRNWLKAVLGVGAVFEIWQVASGGSLFSRIFNRHKGKFFIKRLFLYVVVFFVIHISKRRMVMDRQEHERIVTEIIEQWLAGTVTLMGCLVESQGSLPKKDEQELLKHISRKIMELKRVPSENLDAAVEGLFQELKNMGFEISKPCDHFVWDNQSHLRYDVFGHVEPGDKVVIENNPVIVQGSVLQKGLVRKLRERN